MTAVRRVISRRAALTLYLVGSGVAHLVWETLQLPLYTLWRTATTVEIAIAVGHCTVGDVMIAAVSLLAAVIAVRDWSWPLRRSGAVVVGTCVVGVAITIVSEWTNTAIRYSWAYSDLMPIVPVIGTGLAPLLQWIVVPLLVFAVVDRRITDGAHTH